LRPVEGDARRERIALLGRLRGRLEKLGEVEAAVIAVERAPCVDGARHRDREGGIVLDGVTPWAAASSRVAPAGARPEPLIVVGAAPGFATIAKQSPPMPVMAGSTTPSMAQAAMAASTALPPRRITSRPASEACGCEVAIMARVP
jgi:hypothetical protein